MAGKELDPIEYDPVIVGHVDTNEVPSAAWGWSGESRRTFQVAGWVVIAILLLMQIGNHQGHVEDVFLVVIAALMAVILIRDSILHGRPR